LKTDEKIKSKISHKKRSTYKGGTKHAETKRNDTGKKKDRLHSAEYHHALYEIYKKSKKEKAK